MERDIKPRKLGIGGIIGFLLLLTLTWWDQPADVSSWRFWFCVGLTVLAGWAVVDEICANRKYRAWVKWDEAGGPDADSRRA